MITEIIFSGNRINRRNRAALQTEIIKALKAGSDEIHIKFKSRGGEIYEGIEFYNFIKDLPSNGKAKLYIHTCGPIQSSAILFFLSFENRNIGDNSSFKLHKVRHDGRSAITEKKKKQMECFNEEMIKIIDSTLLMEKDEIDILRNTYKDLDFAPNIAITKNFGVKMNRVFFVNLNNYPEFRIK